MSVQELIAEIPKLTRAEQWALLQALEASLGTESLSARAPGVPAREVRGIIKLPDGKVPDDLEVEEIIFESLLEKHI